MLGVADGVVAGVADGTAAEPGQLRKMDRRVFRKQRLEFSKWIVRLSLDVGTVTGLVDNGQLVATSFDAEERIRSEKAVASDLLSADDAFEQKRMLAVADLPVGGDRRQRVTEDLPVNGNQLHASGEVSDSFEIGGVRHEIGSLCG